MNVIPYNFLMMILRIFPESKQDYSPANDALVLQLVLRHSSPRA
jgi:hypothetical protein